MTKYYHQIFIFNNQFHQKKFSINIKNTTIFIHLQITQLKQHRNFQFFFFKNKFFNLFHLNVFK